jgi:hypothetical protein
MAIDIKSEMAALDNKDRGFYDRLTAEEKKKFSNYLMLRWGSSVQGAEDQQYYYLFMTNQRLNKNFFNVPKGHEKLQWLAATTISPGAGLKYHEWIAPKKKEVTSSNKSMKFLREIYPHAKEADLEIMCEMNDLKTLKQYAKDLGWTPEQIKKELG